MDIWQKMYERLKPCISHRKSQTLSMLDMLWLPLSLKMGKFSRAFVWKGRVVFPSMPKRAALFNMYQETGQNKVRQISPLSNHSRLMVDRLACLVGPVENF